MKKTLIIIGLILGVLAVAGVKYVMSEKELYSMSNPSGELSVRIYQKRGYILFDRFVYLAAVRKNETLVKKLLYTGDFLDRDFTEIYPKHSWLTNSILKIGAFESAQSNKVHISNLSSRKIDYLLVETYEDKFFLFDIGPKSVIDIDFRYLGMLSVQGQFNESGARFGDAIELLNKNLKFDTVKFSITVNDGGVRIESQELEIKHVRCCAVDRPAFDKEF